MSAENWKLAAMAINDPTIKLHRECWATKEYIRFDDACSKDWVDNDGDLYEPDFSTGQFKIYEEPKKKKKLYKFAILTASSSIWFSYDQYFECESDVIQYCASKIIKIIRRDDTMIEVDE